MKIQAPPCLKKLDPHPWAIGARPNMIKMPLILLDHLIGRILLNFFRHDYFFLDPSLLKREQYKTNYNKHVANDIVITWWLRSLQIKLLFVWINTCKARIEQNVSQIKAIKNI